MCIVGVLHRVIGLSNLPEHFVGAGLALIFIIIVIGVYVYVNCALQNLTLQQV